MKWHFQNRVLCMRIQIRGVPQLQVIHVEHLYGYEWHLSVMVEYESSLFTEIKSDFEQHAWQNVYPCIHFEIWCDFGQRIAQNLIWPVQFWVTCCKNLIRLWAGMCWMSTMMYRGTCPELPKAQQSSSSVKKIFLKCWATVRHHGNLDSQPEHLPLPSQLKLSQRMSHHLTGGRFWWE